MVLFLTRGVIRVVNVFNHAASLLVHSIASCFDSEEMLGSGWKPLRGAPEAGGLIKIVISSNSY